MSDTWKVTCVGTVTAIDVTPTDKSASSDRSMTTLTVELESAEVDSDGVTLGATLELLMDSHRLRHKLRRAPAVGDRLRVEAEGTGIRPRHARIKTVLRLDEATP